MLPGSVNRLRELSVKGYRSLADVRLTRVGDATVLIGPNGAGKSNLLDLLRMLSFLHRGALRRFVGEAGGATALLHYGPSSTTSIELELQYQVDRGTVGYRAELGHAADDSLFFISEDVGDQRAQGPCSWESLGEGHVESRLRDAEGPIARAVLGCLQRTTFLHVHDTSARSPMRQNSRAEDAQHLRSNASNLAAFLLSLEQDSSSRVAWRRIGRLVRRVSPSVQTLVPTRTPSSTASAVRLDWIDDQDQRFGSAALSDGTLRAIAIITALAQPSSRLPLLIAIDEPELGLHPAALGLVCELVRSVSHQVQVLLASQSPIVLDHFEPQDVIVTERIDRSTRLRQLDPPALQRWLQECTTA
jgi:predicted ATPase